MNQKEHIMKNLGLTSEQADELLDYDKRIEKGERVEYDLTIEQEKEAKKMANATTKKKTTKAPKKRVENPTKREIITSVAQALSGYENVKVENAERFISFNVGDDRFTITLTQKRK